MHPYEDLPAYMRFLKTHTPKCPYCTSTMEAIHGSRGWFWGCPKYPKCNGSREYLQSMFQAFMDHTSKKNTEIVMKTPTESKEEAQANALRLIKEALQAHPELAKEIWSALRAAAGA